MRLHKHLCKHVNIHCNMYIHTHIHTLYAHTHTIYMCVCIHTHHIRTQSYKKYIHTYDTFTTQASPQACKACKHPLLCVRIYACTCIIYVYIYAHHIPHSHIHTYINRQICPRLICTYIRIRTYITCRYRPYTHSVIYTHQIIHIYDTYNT
jgi:hypothetical protein